jgi:hypothetical protein
MRMLYDDLWVRHIVFIKVPDEPFGTLTRERVYCVDEYCVEDYVE